MRLVVALLALLAALPAARADDGDASPRESSGTVAVLPWTAPNEDLEVYGELLAQSLVSRLGKATKVPLQSVTSRSKMPENIELVIDGRILVDGDAIALEARIRDPLLGRTLSTERSPSVTLAQLDSAAAKLATALAPALEEAFARKAEAAQAIALAPKGGQPARPVTQGQPARPRMVVVRVAGRVAGGLIPVWEPATQAAVAMATRMGFEPVPVGDRGLLSRKRAQALAREHNASHALVLFVDSIEFGWRGVLVAKGKLRVALLNAAGDVLFDRRIQTDTLVGSRGDSRPALVFLVAEQAGLIAEPLLRKKLR